MRQHLARCYPGAKWKAADISKSFKEGRVPQPGPANGTGYDTGERPVTPPSDTEVMSAASTLGPAQDALPGKSPSAAASDLLNPRKILEAKMGGAIPRTPIRSPGFSDGVSSTVATPGGETPSVTPSPFALLVALNGSLHGGGSPKPKSSLNHTTRSKQTGDDEDGDTDDDGDGGWSTVGNNPFSRQNSMAVSRQGSFVGPSAAPTQPTFTSQLVSLNEEG